MDVKSRVEFFRAGEHAWGQVREALQANCSGFSAQEVVLANLIKSTIEADRREAGAEVVESYRLATPFLCYVAGATSREALGHLGVAPSWTERLVPALEGRPGVTSCLGTIGRRGRAIGARHSAVGWLVIAHAVATLVRADAAPSLAHFQPGFGCCGVIGALVQVLSELSDLYPTRPSYNPTLWHGLLREVVELAELTTEPVVGTYSWGEHGFLLDDIPRPADSNGATLARYVENNPLGAGMLETVSRAAQLTFGAARVASPASQAKLDAARGLVLHDLLRASAKFCAAHHPLRRLLQTHAGMFAEFAGCASLESLANVGVTAAWAERLKRESDETTAARVRNIEDCGERVSEDYLSGDMAFAVGSANLSQRMLTAPNVRIAIADDINSMLLFTVLGHWPSRRPSPEMREADRRGWLGAFRELVRLTGIDEGQPDQLPKDPETELADGAWLTMGIGAPIEFSIERAGRRHCVLAGTVDAMMEALPVDHPLRQDLGPLVVARADPQTLERLFPKLFEIVTGPEAVHGLDDSCRLLVGDLVELVELEDAPAS